MRILIAGWFSYTEGHATAGDLLSCRLVAEWAAGAGVDYEIAFAPPFEGGVDISGVDPSRYFCIVFVCGPFQKGELEARLLSRFGHSRLIGLNLSMEIPLSQWNPFDALIERDSSARVNPDLVFLSQEPLVPVVGVCLVEDYDGAITQVANAAIEKLKEGRELAFVPIDTRLDANEAGLRTPAEVEALIARMDAIITTRLHGTVLALKNGVPAIAIDPVAGGAKIRKQMERIGWPVCLNADALTPKALDEALSYCLSAGAREETRVCSVRAQARVREIRDEFVRILRHPGELDETFRMRIAQPVDVGWMRQLLVPEPEEEPEPAPLPTRLSSRSILSRISRLRKRSKSA